MFFSFLSGGRAGYATSKGRLALLAVLFVGVVAMLRTPAAVGQATPAPAGTPGGSPAASASSGAASPEAPKIHLWNMIPNDGVTWTITAASLVGVTLIVQGFIKTRRDVYMPPGTVNALAEMIQGRQLNELLAFTEKDDSFVSRALHPALKRAPSFVAMKEALETSCGEETANSFRKIEYLNIIGNMGPLLGLLGTVLGMIEAFGAMQQAGPSGANPSSLSGGIATALAHTFLGLALAIPCLAAFGVLRTLTDKLTVEASLKAEELLNILKPAEAPAARAVSAAGAAASASPVPRSTSSGSVQQ